MLRFAASILALLISLGITAGAQEYRNEIGAALGVSGYLGDCNKSNFLKHPGVAGGAVFRYVFNYRMAVKANLSMATLSGNSRFRRCAPRW